MIHILCKFRVLLRIHVTVRQEEFFGELDQWIIQTVKTLENLIYFMQGVILENCIMRCIKNRDFSEIHFEKCF